MKLIGTYFSPFVRRVAVSMNLMGIPFEHEDIRVFQSPEAVRDANPLVRIPTLVLAAGGDLLTPGGEALAGALPDARAVVVPEAGHALAIEAPKDVHRAIAAHLAAVDG